MAAPLGQWQYLESERDNYTGYRHNEISIRFLANAYFQFIIFRDLSREEANTYYYQAVPALVNQKLHNAYLRQVR